jgi:pilus assembly protein Flp/PilA
MFRWIGRLKGDERGATAIEYGLIVALIFLVTLGALRAVAGTTVGVWTNVANKVGDAAS